MPRYDFQCNQCNKISEMIVPSSVKTIKCQCGGEMKRLFPKRVTIIGMQYNPKMERDFYKVYDDDSEPDWGLLEDAKKDMEKAKKEGVISA